MLIIFVVSEEWVQCSGKQAELNVSLQHSGSTKSSVLDVIRLSISQRNNQAFAYCFGVTYQCLYGGIGS